MFLRHTNWYQPSTSSNYSKLLTMIKLVFDSLNLRKHYNCKWHLKILWKLYEPLGTFVALTENLSEHFIFSNKHELNKTFHKLYFIIVTLTKGLTLKVKEIFKSLSQATKLFLVWHTTRFLTTLMRLEITEQ